MLEEILDFRSFEYETLQRAADLRETYEISTHHVMRSLFLDVSDLHASFLMMLKVFVMYENTHIILLQTNKVD